MGARADRPGLSGGGGLNAPSDLKTENRESDGGGIECGILKLSRNWCAMAIGNQMWAKFTPTHHVSKQLGTRQACLPAERTCLALLVHTPLDGRSRHGDAQHFIAIRRKGRPALRPCSDPPLVDLMARRHLLHTPHTTPCPLQLDPSRAPDSSRCDSTE